MAQTRWYMLTVVLAHVASVNVSASLMSGYAALMSNPAGCAALLACFALAAFQAMQHSGDRALRSVMPLVYGDMPPERTAAGARVTIAKHCGTCTIERSECL